MRPNPFISIVCHVLAQSVCTNRNINAPNRKTNFPVFFFPRGPSAACDRIQFFETALRNQLGCHQLVAHTNAVASSASCWFDANKNVHKLAHKAYLSLCEAFHMCGRASLLTR